MELESVTSRLYGKVVELGSWVMRNKGRIKSVRAKLGISTPFYLISFCPLHMHSVHGVEGSGGLRAMERSHCPQGYYKLTGEQ